MLPILSWRIKQKQSVLTWIDNKLPFLFPAPIILFLLFLMLYPLLHLIFMSSLQTALDLRSSRFVGLKWYIELFKNQAFLKALVRTGYYILLTLLPEMGLGIVMALILAKDFKGVVIFRTAFLLPLIAMPVASALVWLTMFNPSLGVLNYFLDVIGLPASLWIFHPDTVLPSIALIEIWIGAPFVMLILVGALRALPKHLYEVARIDGASNWQLFYYLTIPLIRPSLVVAALLRIIEILKVFSVIWILTQGGPLRASETLSVYSYKVGFYFMNVGFGSAAMVIFTVVSVATSLIFIKMRYRAWSQ